MVLFKLFFGQQFLQILGGQLYFAVMVWANNRHLLLLNLSLQIHHHALLMQNVIAIRYHSEAFLKILHAHSTLFLLLIISFSLSYGLRQLIFICEVNLELLPIPDHPFTHRLIPVHLLNLFNKPLGSCIHLGSLRLLFLFLLKLQLLCKLLR